MPQNVVEHIHCLAQRLEKLLTLKYLNTVNFLQLHNILQLLVMKHDENSMLLVV